MKGWNEGICSVNRHPFTPLASAAARACARAESGSPSSSASSVSTRSHALVESSTWLANSVLSRDASTRSASMRVLCSGGRSAPARSNERTTLSRCRRRTPVSARASSVPAYDLTALHSSAFSGMRAKKADTSGSTVSYAWRSSGELITEFRCDTGRIT